MKWFRHNTDSHRDAKLRKLTMRYGAEGYALYWYCIELITGSLSADNLTFELEHDAEIIASDLRIDTLRVNEIMSFMVNLGLFEGDDNRITCLKVAKHLDERFAATIGLKQAIHEAKRGGLTRDRLRVIVGTSPRPSPETSEDPLKIDCRLSPLQDKTIHNKTIPSTTHVGQDEPDPTPAEVNSSSKIPYDEIVGLYNRILCPPLPLIRILTDKRRNAIRSRWNDGLSDLGEWEGYFNRVAKSDFLCGRVAGRNGATPFMASIDFLLRPDTPVKVLEGIYSNRKQAR